MRRTGRLEEPDYGMSEGAGFVNTALLEVELDQGLMRHAGTVIAFAEARDTKGELALTFTMESEARRASCLPPLGGGRVRWSSPVPHGW